MNENDKKYQRMKYREHHQLNKGKCKRPAANAHEGGALKSSPQGKEEDNRVQS